MKQLTKSDFLNYLQCPEYFWFTKHQPERLTAREMDPFVQQLIEQGNEVEVKARELFPKGVLVQSYEDTSLQTTQHLMNQGVGAIFQASFQFENLYIRMDCLERTATGWTIYEVKSTSSKDVKKEEHRLDAAFQAYVFQQLGFRLNAVVLIELNKDFVKQGAIDARELFTLSDITDDVDQLQDNVERAVVQMDIILRKTIAPKSCDCIRFSKRNWCPAVPVMYPNLPEYPIQEISRVKPAKIKALQERGVTAIENVPPDFQLSDNQRNQVDVYQKGKPIKNREDIRNEFSKIVYPLYFLDYETFPAAIPVYDGCSPYNQVPFQFSLHIIQEEGRPPEHIEYLHRDHSSPTLPLATALCDHIGAKGAVIVWNKSFERGCNELLARLHPQVANELLSINNRLFDLWDVFKQQLYVDAGFRGKTSIKNVLPVLCPELSYDALAISNGGLATSKFREMAFGELSESEQHEIAQNLLEYCKLDTWAMVRIWEELCKVIT